MSKETKGTSGAPESIELPLRFTRSDDMRLFFSNFVQASAGQSGEVQIFFGQLVSHPLSKTPPAEAVVRQDVGVTMTIFEYKRMVTMLAGMVPKFEEMAASQMASLEEPALPPPPGFEK